ncbi:MAG TPA: ester cyclase [Terracidiphilus sp.]|jgi:predicted ester cyclase|nr:ester cyclase [Terracidiphilus sp.]
MNSVAIDNKQLVQEYFNALSGQPKTEKLLDRYISDPGLKEHIRGAEAAFPEYELIASLLVAEGDLVAARCTFRGFHKGEFAGIQPTGKSVSSDLMIFYRIREGRIVEHWLQMDTRGLIDQLTN